MTQGEGPGQSWAAGQLIRVTFVTEPEGRAWEGAQKLPRRQSCSPSLNSNPDHDPSWSPRVVQVASYPVKLVKLVKPVNPRPGYGISHQDLGTPGQPGSRLSVPLSPVVAPAHAATVSTDIQAAHACAFRFPPHASHLPPFLVQTACPQSHLHIVRTRPSTD